MGLCCAEHDTLLHPQAEIDFKTAPWPQVSSHAKEIVKWLLTVDVKQRPSAEQVLQVWDPAHLLWHSPDGEVQAA